MEAGESSPRRKALPVEASIACIAAGSHGPAAGMTLESGRITHGGAQSAASTKLPWKPPTVLIVVPQRTPPRSYSSEMYERVGMLPPPRTAASMPAFMPSAGSCRSSPAMAAPEAGARAEARRADGPGFGSCFGLWFGSASGSGSGSG